MAESSSHIYLVEQLVNIMLTSYELDNYYSFIDHPSSKQKPMKLRGYFPDYYYYNPVEAILVIGEAKTSNDLMNKHTINQITAFLQECNESKTSRFVLAVPWQLVNYSKDMLRKICFDNGLMVDCHVLENLKDSR